MVYTYTPTYYSSFQDTLTSLCKTILLPSSLKNRRLPGDQKLAKKQSDNLKWQQESFHKILNLIGLHKEGIVVEAEVSAFRSHMLDALIASPSEEEAVGVIRDKLLFLQELFYVKCISADEYHSSKRPLLQRLAVQGAEIDCKDVIMGENTTKTQEEEEEEWLETELRDKECPKPTEKTKHRTTPIKSLINWKSLDKKDNKNAAPNNETSPSILVPESSPKSKRKPFRSLFNKEQKEHDATNKKKSTSDSKRVKKQWGFDRLKKWKRSNHEEGEFPTPCLLSDGISSSVACTLVASPICEGPDAKRIKKKIHSDGSSSDFFIDKVLGDNIKKELSRIQSQLSATHPNLNLSDDQMEAISTRLPVGKADLNNFFPKPWCDRYGDIVLDVVKKEFKDHIGEMATNRYNARALNGSNGSSRRVAFAENDENHHPNEGINYGTDCTVNNPFIDDHQNLFWTTRN